MPKKSYTHMSFEERETLSLGLSQGQSLRTMAAVLGRSPSSMSREYARNATQGHPYRACTAHSLAAVRSRRPRRSRKLLDPWLWRYVQTHLVRGCSPEQIAGRLRREYPDDMQKRLSAETIYVALYVLPRGTLRSALLAALRQARQTRCCGLSAFSMITACAGSSTLICCPSSSSSTFGQPETNGSEARGE